MIASSPLRSLGVARCWLNSRDPSLTCEPRITGYPRFPEPNPGLQICKDRERLSRDFSLDLRFPEQDIQPSSGSRLDPHLQPRALSGVPRARRPALERPRMAGPCPGAGVLERAGSCWQDPLAEALSRGRSSPAVAGRGYARSRPLSVVYVLTREPGPGVEPGSGTEAEPLPLRCLREACAQLQGTRPPPQLRSLPFATLALGDTAALDSFYNAGERLGAGLERGRDKRRSLKTPDGVGVGVYGKLKPDLRRGSDNRNIQWMRWGLRLDLGTQAWLLSRSLSIL